jgi:endothelin-converting enzyme
VQDWYSTIGITKNTSWFENGVLTYRFIYGNMFNGLLKPVNRHSWIISANFVNAYYNPPGNDIVFPAGIMQPPFFGSDLPEYVSYGAFGSVAGHELTHGFDDHGSLFDQRGALKEWWDDKTRANFNDRAQCFVQQFEKYTIPGLEGRPLNINGKLTLGENIADSGGLKAAYAAWKKRDTEKPNQLLPGLENFSRDQMFFISFAGWWCGKARNGQAVEWIYTDPHSPADKRIIGSVANSEAFREAFNCPSKKPTCELW